MSFEYPQFGNPDYSGFTTDEELARRYIATEARGSPTIGARMYMPTAAMPPPLAGPVCGQPPPNINGAEQMPASAPMPVSEERPKSVSEAVMEIFRSRPLSALDWIIIFILIIAAICFFQYANDLVSTLFRTKRPGAMGGIIGGNFCATCGGTV